MGNLSRQNKCFLCFPRVYLKEIKSNVKMIQNIEVQRKLLLHRSSPRKNANATVTRLNIFSLITGLLNLFPNGVSDLCHTSKMKLFSKAVNGF